MDYLWKNLLGYWGSALIAFFSIYSSGFVLVGSAVANAQAFSIPIHDRFIDVIKYRAASSSDFFVYASRTDGVFRMEATLTTRLSAQDVVDVYGWELDLAGIPHTVVQAGPDIPFITLDADWDGCNKHVLIMSLDNGMGSLIKIYSERRDLESLPEFRSILNECPELRLIGTQIEMNREVFLSSMRSGILVFADSRGGKHTLDNTVRFLKYRGWIEDEQFAKQPDSSILRKNNYNAQLSVSMVDNIVKLSVVWSVTSNLVQK